MSKDELIEELAANLAEAEEVVCREKCNLKFGDLPLCQLCAVKLWRDSRMKKADTPDHDKLVAEAFQAEIANTIKSNNRAKDSEYVKATYTKAELVAELNTQLGQILSNVHTEVMRAEGHPPCKTGGSNGK